MGTEVVVHIHNGILFISKKWNHETYREMDESGKCDIKWGALT